MTANRDLANGKFSGRDAAGSCEVQRAGVSLLLVAPADEGRSAMLSEWISAVEKLPESLLPIEILHLSYGGEAPAFSDWGSSIQVRHLHASDRAAAERRGILEARGARVVLIDIERVVCTDDLDLLLAAVQRHSRVAGRSINRAGPWGARLRRMWIDGIVRWVGGTGLRDASCGVEAFENRRAMAVSEGGLRGRLQRVLLDRDRGTKAIEVPLRTGETAESEEGREGWRGVAALTIWVLRNAWQNRWFPRRELATRGRIDLRATRWSNVMVSAVLLLGFAGLLIGRLDFALVEPDETRNVQIGLEMARSGDFVLPTRHGDPYLDKPAMLFWAMATSGRLGMLGDGDRARVTGRSETGASCRLDRWCAAGHEHWIYAVGPICGDRCAADLLCGLGCAVAASRTCLWRLAASLVADRGSSPSGWNFDQGTRGSCDCIASMAGVDVARGAIHEARALVIDLVDRADDRDSASLVPVDRPA